MVSKQFARCLAKISGDGNLCKYYLRYSNTCDFLREEFKEDMKSEFGYTHFCEGAGNSGTKFVQVHGKGIVEKFLKEMDDFRSCFVSVPQRIVHSKNLSVISAYLRALYDDEGCVALRLYRKTNEWKRNITLTSNSVKLLMQVKDILFLKFDINSNKIIPNATNRDRDKSFVLAISGRENISKFKRGIGFKHPQKKEKISLMIASYFATSKNKVKFEELKKELIRSQNKKGGQLS